MTKKSKKMSHASKLKFLRDYLNRWSNKWHAIHPQNISGFRIDKKMAGDIKTSRYSVVFQVVEKKTLKLLRKNLRIPVKLRIKFPDGKFRQVPTDVQETGRFELHSGICDEIDSNYSREFGTASLFVADDNNIVYALTNYHVAAQDMMFKGIYYYRLAVGATQPDISIKSPDGSLTPGLLNTGTISHVVDIAFIQVQMPVNPDINILPNGQRVQGKVAVRPIPGSFQGKPVVVYSHFNPGGINSTILNNSAPVYTADPNIYFTEMIQLAQRVTNGGDSGSIVCTPSNAVLGIIIGADSQYSYVLPFYRITDFKDVIIP